MMESPIGFLLLPIVLIYGLTLLRFLAHYFTCIFGKEREEDRIDRPRRYRNIYMLPSSELALASVALDLAAVVGR